ncbi:hypothetical protein [Rossellomorea marisflavi]|uniref:hypothetical protein n=1 Tax=Rossellomorea marisflavi TaxID=189381 RepID=UPI00345852CB
MKKFTPEIFLAGINSAELAKYEVVDRRNGDIASCYADASKAERELAWKAKKDLVSMCRYAWRFEKNHQE